MSEQLPPFLQTCFDAIGVDHTIAFVLQFGGGVVYLTSNPTAESAVAQAIGLGPARDLGQVLGPGHVKVPVAKRWLARHLFNAGWPKTKIARRLFLRDETVYGYLKGLERSSAVKSASRQLDLFA